MASNYSYPLLPPGFGYSQNTSVADGTSIGVLNEEDTALTPTVPSSHAMQAVPAVQTMQSVQTVQGVQAGTTGQEKPRRSMKLKNKVYFQLLEVTNDLQKRLSQRGAPMTKLNSAAVARLARYVNGRRTRRRRCRRCRRRSRACCPPSTCVRKRSLRPSCQRSV